MFNVLISMGRAIGTGNNVHYIEAICYWEGPLIEVHCTFSPVILKFLFSERFNQDPLESFIGKHHRLGGCSNVL